MVRPTKLYWKAAKHFLRYLRGTTKYGLWYRRTEGVKLQCFIDENWETSPSDRKITLGDISNVGFVFISSYIKKKRYVALSSAEVEYMDASQAACEAIWMTKILVGLFSHEMDLTYIYCDNQSCIKCSENPIFHDRSKHIDIFYHHLWNCVQRRIMFLTTFQLRSKMLRCWKMHCQEVNSNSIGVG